eukprot:TRINITY_DN4232_c0_g1_i2.p1 TRINITY_DN4232_c0_g1~~TRINITY_DN4232_c0_g1_i2.p1  ORF type:complete len:215 (-),score=51.80 TRINITY_DN4232_c0_g1_i2:30-674(-)
MSLMNILAVIGVGLNVIGKAAYITKIPELVKFGRTMMKPKNRKWIYFEVGGTQFHTTKTTLLRSPGSIFDIIVQEEEKEYQQKYAVLPEEEKMVLQRRMNKWHRLSSDMCRIDRDPATFAVVLNYMRCGKLLCPPNVLLESVLEEAKFFEIKHLEKLARDQIQKKKDKEKKLEEEMEIVKQGFQKELTREEKEREERIIQRRIALGRFIKRVDQ